MDQLEIQGFSKLMSFLWRKNEREVRRILMRKLGAIPYVARQRQRQNKERKGREKKRHNWKGEN